MKTALKRRRLQTLVFLGLLLWWPLAGSVHADGKLETNDLVAICGDSITEQRIYSALMEQYLVMCQPGRSLNAVQFGWGGEKASGLALRLGTDVLPFKPNVATTCYGMNDGGYKPVAEETLKEFRRQMSGVVRQLKKAGVRFIIVGSPGVVDPATFRKAGVSSEEYNKTLESLGAVSREIAETEGVAFADLHSVMMEGMTKAKGKYGEAYQIAPDGIHPFGNGHLVMAYVFLKALGCDGDIGRITYDFSSGNASCDPAQKVGAAANGTIELESTRYPFCFSGQAGDTNTRSMLEFIPFNQDLNRYVLVVQNAPARTKITWGNESRTYSSEELEKGVNLAADFIDHPFQAPFEDVAKLIQKQQDFEVGGIKNLLHTLAFSKYMLPEELDKFDSLISGVQKKDFQLRQDVAAAIKPVKHTIKIEPAP